MKKLFIFSLPFLFASCINTGKMDSAGNYEISLDDNEKQYVPTTSNQLEDPVYMNLINALIEDEMVKVSSDPEFLILIKAIAWTESNWKHYYESNGKYYVLLGDNGHSFGIMQIYDSYHGEHPILKDNLDYGIAFAYEKYQRAQTGTCSSGTNAGTDTIAIARRSYAQYNGGNDAMCRDNDGRDNNLEDAFTNEIWKEYL